MLIEILYPDGTKEWQEVDGIIEEKDSFSIYYSTEDSTSTLYFSTIKELRIYPPSNDAILAYPRSTHVSNKRV